MFRIFTLLIIFLFVYPEKSFAHNHFTDRQKFDILALNVIKLRPFGNITYSRYKGKHRLMDYEFPGPVKEMYKICLGSTIIKNAKTLSEIYTKHLKTLRELSYRDYVYVANHIGVLKEFRSDNIVLNEETCKSLYLNEWE